MPRLIKQDLFYERKITFHGSWPVNSVRRTFKKCKRKGVLLSDSEGRLYCRILQFGAPRRLRACAKVSYRQIPIYRQALARARECDYQDFITKCRKNSSLEYQPSCRSRLQQICNSEALALENRATTQHKQYLKHLKKQKYG